MLDLFNNKKTWEERKPAIDRSEQLALDFIGVKNHVLTEGYAPEYDAIDDDGIKYEVKYSTMRASAQSKGRTVYFPLYLEYKRPSGEPSGLLLSEADYYVAISPGYNYYHDKVVGKVRLFERSLLKFCLKTASGVVHMDEQFVGLDTKLVKHDWFGDVEAIVNNSGKLVGYNMVRL